MVETGSFSLVFSLYFGSAWLSMERLRHQNQPLPASPDVSDPDPASRADVVEYTQLQFDGLDVPTVEVEVARLLVTSAPVVKKRPDGNEWVCKVTYQRDLWHQEEYYSFVLHATKQFEQVKSLKIRKGETLSVRGTPWKQKIPLHGGGVNVINHINVSEVTVTSRAQPGTRR